MRRRYILFVAVTLAIIAADQGTKWWAATTLAERRIERARPACDEDGPIARRPRYRPIRQIDVVQGLFSLRYVENCAGAFGILSDQDESVRRPFFLAVSFAAVLFIVLLFRRLQPDQVLLIWALPFVLGGALGNFIDRLHLKYVIDFIDWYHPSLGRWPTFNIADAAIVVGVALIIIDMFRTGHRSKVESETEAETETEAESKARGEADGRSEDEAAEESGEPEATDGDRPDRAGAEGGDEGDRAKADEAEPAGSEGKEEGTSSSTEEIPGEVEAGAVPQPAFGATGTRSD